MPQLFTETNITSSRDVESLAWDGDYLVDWVAGGHRYGLDGSFESAHVFYAYRFDASLVSPSGRYVVLFTSIGTKAVLLRDGSILRQLNRDFYHADAYLYPLAFARLPNGREVLIHCPDNYCQLEVEDAETGDKLTTNVERKSQDIFHSRLSTSSDGRWLLSAGWEWHPLDVVCVYDLTKAIEDPETLDTGGTQPPGLWEKSSAAFVDNYHLVVGTSDEFYGNEGSAEELQPGKYSVALWRIGDSSYSTSVELPHHPGTLLPINERFILSMFGHPKLVDLEKRQVVHVWEEIQSGEQRSSITWDNLPPPIAFDPHNARFAIVQGNTIKVITINAQAL